MYYVYLVVCADKSIYTGYTTDLARRIKAHNSAKTGAHYTKTRRPVKLCYHESFTTLSEALKREAQIKQWPRAKKLLLIRQAKPFSKRKQPARPPL